MKVLLLGSTGNLGTRILPALLAYSHEPVLYVRNASRVPEDIRSSIKDSNIITGDGLDSAAITKTILDHNCEAVISSAGCANMFSKNEQFPKIFKAVVEAVAAAAQQRGRPIRCWMLSGFGLLDVPGTKDIKMEHYLPLFPDHKENYACIQKFSKEQIAWSLLCANQLNPSKDPNPTAQAKADSAKVIASADVPPQWKSTMGSVPLLGGFLNVMGNAMSYQTSLEQAADVIVRDLDRGMDSEFIGHRVGFKFVE